MQKWLVGIVLGAGAITTCFYTSLTVLTYCAEMELRLDGERKLQQWRAEKAKLDALGIK